MDSLRSGTFMGSGSFRCTHCGYIVTLDGSERLPECPSCSAEEFVRASMFSTERIPPASEPTSTGATVMAAPSPELDTRLAQARERVDQPGDYVVYEESGELRVIPLTREWTRVGRSLAADVRFDDPTASRRHALIVRQAGWCAPARRPLPERGVRERHEGRRPARSATAMRSSWGATTCCSCRCPRSNPRSVSQASRTPRLHSVVLGPPRPSSAPAGPRRRRSRGRPGKGLPAPISGSPGGRPATSVEGA